MALKRGRSAAANAPRWLPAVLLLLAAGTAPTGCASPAHPHATAVVASTGVWGSVARAITGRRVAVTTLLPGGDTDPHSYQASPSDAAAITDASLVVYNGGGYDPWVDQVLAGHPGVKSIDAYAFLKNSGTAAQQANEHVFYNLDVAKSVAFAIADRMAVVDPVHAADYRANAAEFCRGADGIAISEHAIASAYPGTGVITTEPVAYYLLAASGLVNRTPQAFTAANENETDPAPADMAFVLDLIDHRQVSAVLINPQTSTTAINGVRDAARRAGVPVTEVSETLPDGTDYLSWQRNTVNQLLTVLQSGRSVQP
ncbi:ABC transporter substrate-binding protein [Mycobacterium sp. 852002-53434_SCH5985345]|uniref:metal ABC transporter solute-binding protein, Zn/Mn family n=1 Tax=Mycobacterium sp. 852002-53434_SCH5985345 TaxID=1834107 RepID=UPI0007FBA6B8|nr:zinc ABC transporter substrate-binding protein [Mycobacterium sp. 852002-53434_SCH5985345]OBF51780.1 ABC transporter substrate-binding protein [Mycobacterium sp. 852002-53434_SCH5985345]